MAKNTVKTRKSTKKAKHPSEITPKEYGQIIKGLDLQDIRLVSGAVKLMQRVPPLPSEIQIEVSDKASYEHAKDNLYDISHGYVISVHDTAEKKKFLEITVDFLLTFRSKHEFSESFFEKFREINLPINTWPYMREFVDNMTSRLHVPPIRIPLLKRV